MSWLTDLRSFREAGIRLDSGPGASRWVGEFTLACQGMVGIGGSFDTLEVAMSANKSLIKKVSRSRSAKRIEDDKVAVENVNVPGYTTRVDAGMYNAMRRALLKVLPTRAPGLTQAGMIQAVVAHLPEGLFPGGAKAGWWAKCVQLDLEAKGIVTREETKPLRWHRVTGK